MEDSLREALSLATSRFLDSPEDANYADEIPLLLCPENGAARTSHAWGVARAGSRTLLRRLPWLRTRAPAALRTGRAR